jgi:outer membrane protein assembly factor BamB
VVTPTPITPLSAEWTEYHRDAARSGLGPSQPALNGPRVAWSAAVDGDVYASPLIVAGHVIVATENNTVYSLDLFTGAAVWKIHLGDPVDARSLPCGNIGPVTGITGTPAADPATGRVYVVAYLRSHHHMLFGLSMVDGSVVSQLDIDPAGSNPLVQQQRGALSTGSGFVYVPLGGLYGDCGAYHGYVVAAPLAGGPLRSYRVPSAGAGIWTPQGASIASDGSVYVVSGNATSGSGFAYSNSVIQLSPDLSRVKSYFAPANWAALDSADADLGSVGATLLPGGLVVAVGKQGVAYVLKAGSLGGIGGQLASLALCTHAGAWGGTASMDTTVFVPCSDGLYAVSVSASSMRVVWSAAHPVLGSPIVSAGAVWGVEPQSATLYAMDPSDGHALFTTNLGAAAHFSTPAATDGFVVAPAGQKVVAISVVS